MKVKIFGAIMIIVGSGLFGYRINLFYRKEEHALQELITALQFMASELNFRLTELPLLCQMASSQISGPVSKVFAMLAQKLIQQDDANVSSCVETILQEAHDIPLRAGSHLSRLGKTLGRFDLQGQLSGLQAVAELAERDLLGLKAGRAIRLRCHVTLCLCAGAALVILFI